MELENITKQEFMVTLERVCVQRKKPENEPCPWCSQKLRRLNWNSKVNVLLCDNVFCQKFRQPITINKY